MRISDQLRQAVQAYGSVYRVAKDSSVPQPTLQRFITGQSELSLPHVDRLCKFFGMKLTRPKQKPRK
ncbi:helix-turn-helix domain-containing protein [Planctomycetota bacterium]